MNVVPGASVAGRPWLPLPGDPAQLSCGVRAEAARIDPEHGVPAEIVAVEYLGADTLVETRIGGAPFVVRHSGRFDAKPGRAVRLAWAPEEAHWFNAVDGRRAA